MKSDNPVKKSELCADAQNHLWNGIGFIPDYETRRITHYICTAISTAADNLPEHLIPHGVDAAKEIRDYIEAFLGCINFRVFMERQGIPPDLYISQGWIQMRRKEFLCMLQSRYERGEVQNETV